MEKSLRFITLSSSGQSQNHSSESLIQIELSDTNFHSQVTRP